ncbi:UMP kinase [Patescibacteria group bacterium]|nr:UMP kinase [Patescibacteria group bacterium]
MANKTIVMSLGGSLIAPKGVDVKFLKNFKKIIIDFVKKGNRVIIVCGGGDTCRKYQGAAKKVNPKVTHIDLDWVGIATTKINAELVRAIFGNLAYEKVIHNPSAKIKTTKKIIVGAGYLPGSSSDKDAVLIAKNFHAKTLINLSNISYVYDKDPNKFKNAKKYKQMKWNDFQKIVGYKWVPGAHVPFDPIATKLSHKLGLTLVIAMGSDLNNLKSILTNKKIKGTVIS